jgi:hypothetical protein
MQFVYCVCDATHAEMTENESGGGVKNKITEDSSSI